MGFDLFSLDRDQCATKEMRWSARYYFRANVWSWRPILEALAIACEEYPYVDDMTEEEAIGMSSHDYYAVAGPRASDFALALTDLLQVMHENGYRVIYLTDPRRDTKLRAGLAEPVVSFSSDLPLVATPYITTVAHLEEFAAFCASGVGFEVG